jgi:lysophospholipase L1-like esterase
MKFILAGDSWGCGEWMRGDLLNPKKLKAHGGFAQYLEEAGHTVVNLSIGGASNTYVSQSLEFYLSREIIKGTNDKINGIFVVQTTYTRDYRFRYDEDYNKIEHANSLADIWLARFYSRLTETAQKYQIPVFLIGGHCDTVWLDNFEEFYPGVKIVCQSMINLIINSNHRVDVPIFSWYGASDVPLVNEIKQHLNSEQLLQFLNLIDLGYQRQISLSLYPEYFFPDGVHANREGHKILFDFLNTTLIKQLG